MTATRTIVVALWLPFCAYWGLSALGSKRGTRSWGGMLPRALVAIALVLLFTAINPAGFEVHGTVLPVLGTVIVACGLAFAVWARVHIGRNWGMPMTIKAEPELVTSGPYRLIRHPIYTGILTAAVGTALAINLLALAVAAVLAVFFVYSATVEERNMVAIFPNAYPAYRARTKMLIPFVL
ncbi:MAG: isoprenylcysteine carboxylmethyltransferase family protein [Actinobacteria bacterium]|nr:isoprenylcysteine carboxylmethyltransferase family protein [Actinomycetota bacterium]